MLLCSKNVYVLYYDDNVQCQVVLMGVRYARMILLFLGILKYCLGEVYMFFSLQHSLPGLYSEIVTVKAAFEDVHAKGDLGDIRSIADILCCFPKKHQHPMHCGRTWLLTPYVPLVWADVRLMIIVAPLIGSYEWLVVLNRDLLKYICRRYVGVWSGSPARRGLLLSVREGKRLIKISDPAVPWHG